MDRGAEHGSLLADAVAIVAVLCAIAALYAPLVVRF
jgi:hypothetical protein